jgi:hypothetical protein
MSKEKATLDYVNTRFDLLQQEIDRRHADLDRLTEVNRIDMNRRLEGMNEFRAAMADQAARMISRDSFEAQIRAERDRSDSIHTALAESIKPLTEFVKANGAILSSRRINMNLMMQLVSMTVAVVAVVLLVVGI